MPVLLAAAAGPSFPRTPTFCSGVGFSLSRREEAIIPSELLDVTAFILDANTLKGSQECLVPASDIPHQHISVSLIEQSFYWVFAGFHKVQEKLWTSMAPELSVPRF